MEKCRSLLTLRLAISFALQPRRAQRNAFFHSHGRKAHRLVIDATAAMVSLSEVKSGNASLKNRHETLTAVFAGATRGIGLGTLIAFAKHIPKPKAIIIGRSRSHFNPELENLKSINPNGEYTFIEADVSLIKNIDAVCGQIKQQVSSVDLLFVSQGYLNFGDRKNNAEGLDNAISLRYYGRVRFTQNLLPIMTRNARAVSVLAGGMEGKVFEQDLDLEENYSFLNSTGHFATTMTLAYDKLAEQNPEKGFLHIYPGFVNTGVLSRNVTGLLWLLFSAIETVSSFFIIQPDEAGERMLYYGTTQEYATGSWSLGWDGTPKYVKALLEYREKGTADKVEDHNQKIFQRVTSI